MTGEEEQVTWFSISAEARSDEPGGSARRSGRKDAIRFMEDMKGARPKGGTVGDTFKE